MTSKAKVSNKIIVAVRKKPIIK